MRLRCGIIFFMQVISRTKFAAHPKYASVLALYTENIQREQSERMSDNKFFDTVIAKEMPGITKLSWYNFIRKVKNTTGALATIGDQSVIAPTTGAVEAGLERVLLTNDVATQQGIKSALNLGAAFFESLWRKYISTPELLTPFEQKVLSDSMFKAMKAQDSRIHAIGKVKEDGREQAKFDHAFGNAAYE